MMGFTNYLKTQVLNHAFRNTPYAPPTTVYVGLFNGSSEIAGGGYVRQEITFGAPANGVVKNDAEVRFPIAASDWGEITSGSVFDSETGGNRLADGTILRAEFVNENQQFSIPVEKFTVEVK